MILDLFPDPRHLTDREIQTRIDRAYHVSGVDDVDIAGVPAGGLVREQQRRDNGARAHLPQ